tara:strand:+ start:8452 stop:9438 length:987 start_codon:yes stop_codon:yes gene_type:complete
MNKIFIKSLVFSLWFSSYNILAVAEVIDSSEFLDLNNGQDVEIITDLESGSVNQNYQETNSKNQPEVSEQDIQVSQDVVSDFDNSSLEDKEESSRNSFQTKKYDISNLSIPSRMTRLENILDAQNYYKQESVIQELRADIQKLTGKLEEQEHRFTQYQKQQELLSKDKERRLDNIIASLKSNKNSNFVLHDNDTNTNSAVNTEKDVYTQGYDYLKSKQYDKAAYQLQGYLKKYPDGKYVDNANYWLGEVYLLQSNLSGAMDAFNTILTKHPKSEKAKEALLKKGIVYIYQQNFVDAKKTFENLKKQYPNTVVARLAESRLQQIKEQLE